MRSSPCDPEEKQWHEDRLENKCFQKDESKLHRFDLMEFKQGQGKKQKALKSHERIVAFHHLDLCQVDERDDEENDYKIDHGLDFIVENKFKVTLAIPYYLVGINQNSVVVFPVAGLAW